MLEIGRDLDLGQEALGPDHRGQLRLQDLERDLSVVLDVVGEVDGSHPALADVTLDAVPTFQRSVQTGSDVGHGGPRLTGMVDAWYAQSPT